MSIVKNIRNAKKIVKRCWSARALADERGQGMTEYIIIVALIGVASIGVVGLFGDNVRHLFAAASDSIAGNENRQSMAEERGADYEHHESLKTFADQTD